MAGFIKLYRSINKNDLLENDNTAYIVFTKLLTRVDRHTGSYTTGRFKLASMCNIKPSTLYSALKRLETAKMIRQQSNNRMTTIHICNWWKYQQDIDSKSSREQVEINTKQEERKEKENIVSAVGEVKPVKKPKSSGRDILAILNRVTGRNFTAEPRGIEATKAKFTDEQIETALRNMCKDEWHGPKMHELRSDYLLRASTIDNFKNAAKEKKKYLTEYKIPGSVMKTSMPKGESLNRAELLKREYQNG